MKTDPLLSTSLRISARATACLCELDNWCFNSLLFLADDPVALLHLVKHFEIKFHQNLWVEHNYHSRVAGKTYRNLLSQIRLRSTMDAWVGHISGVQACLKQQKCEEAAYVHCRSHLLQLACVQSSEKLKSQLNSYSQQ